ncbi:unnamed protein product [Fusarium graminearum]|uniref:Chromosome 3, complete genome n=3 Tax=Gibberella zeae TaxID=5518 RepID=A0A098E398_GIBZE|nr:unnamed protein product [Fusarium graminearum]CAG1979983.1 unnamed protein product [Fusarium graminearum]CAG1999783.1 unnamed protein product [Fusarium graminearum]CEF88094.1 unnamed protein product [Fusarium graminearum]
MKPPSVNQEADSKAIADWVVASNSDLFTCSDSQLKDVLLAKYKAAWSIKNQTGRTERVIRIWMDDQNGDGDDVGFDSISHFFATQMNQHHISWKDLQLTPEMVAVKDSLLPEHPSTPSTGPQEFLPLRSSPSTTPSTEQHISIDDVSNTQTNSPIESVSLDLASADKEAVDNQIAKHAEVSPNGFFTPTNHTSTMFHWASKRVKTGVKDVTRDIETLLSSIKSNAEMILENEKTQLHTSTSNLMISNKVLDICSDIQKSHRAEEATANEFTTQIETLINASNEACRKTKDSGQVFEKAYKTLGAQLPVLRTAFGRKRILPDAASAIEEGRSHAEIEVKRMVTEVKTIAKRIKEAEELRSEAETELDRILLVNTFAQINGQGVKALKEKHPGLLKDLGDLTKKFVEHSSTS